MKLENIDVVEKLIKERFSIMAFRDNVFDANKNDEVSFNNQVFKVDFKRNLYSKEFINELKIKLFEVCNDYLEKINENLKVL
jgi:hypothetical protein